MEKHAWSAGDNAPRSYNKTPAVEPRSARNAATPENMLRRRAQMNSASSFLMNYQCSLGSQSSIRSAKRVVSASEYVDWKEGGEQILNNDACAPEERAGDQLPSSTTKPSPSFCNPFESFNDFQSLSQCVLSPSVFATTHSDDGSPSGMSKLSIGHMSTFNPAAIDEQAFFRQQASLARSARMSSEQESAVQEAVDLFFSQIAEKHLGSPWSDNANNREKIGVGASKLIGNEPPPPFNAFAEKEVEKPEVVELCEGKDALKPYLYSPDDSGNADSSINSSGLRRKLFLSDDASDRDISTSSGLDTSALQLDCSPPPRYRGDMDNSDECLSSSPVSSAVTPIARTRRGSGLSARGSPSFAFPNFSPIKGNSKKSATKRNGPGNGNDTPLGVLPKARMDRSLSAPKLEFTGSLLVAAKKSDHRPPHTLSSLEKENISPPVLPNLRVTFVSEDAPVQQMTADDTLPLKEVTESYVLPQRHILTDNNTSRAPLSIRNFGSINVGSFDETRALANSSSSGYSSLMMTSLMGQCQQLGTSSILALGGGSSHTSNSGGERGFKAPLHLIGSGMSNQSITFDPQVSSTPSVKKE